MSIVRPGLLLTGEDIDAWCASMRQNWGDKATLHTESNVVLSAAEPGRVRNTSVWSAIVGGQLASFGTHEDVLVATNAGAGGVEWRFENRTIKHLWALPT